jgi:hypothetical protein
MPKALKQYKKKPAKPAKPMPKPPKKVKTVKMVRDDGKTADVHPDEVANYALGGYKKA